MHDRHGAVGHGVELVEAAGFKAGGHEQEVAACRNTVRHAHVEAHPPAALVLPRRLHLPAAPRLGLTLTLAAPRLSTAALPATRFILVRVACLGYDMELPQLNNL